MPRQLSTSQRYTDKKVETMKLSDRIFTGAAILLTAAAAAYVIWEAIKTG